MHKFKKIITKPKHHDTNDRGSKILGNHRPSHPSKNNDEKHGQTSNEDDDMVNNIKHELSDKSEHCKRLEEEIANLKKEINNFQDNLNTTKDELEKEKSKILKENANLKTELKDSKDNLSTMKNELEREKSERYKILEEENANLKAELEGSKDNLNTMKNELEEEKSKILKENANLKTELKDFKDNLNTLKNELEEEKSERCKILEEENASLKAELNDSKGSLNTIKDNLEKEKSKILEENANLKTELKDFKDNLNTTKNKLEKEESERCKILEEENASLKAELNNSKDSLNTIKNELEKEKSKILEENANLKTELKDSKDKLSTLEKENSERCKILEKENANLKAELNDSKNSLNTIKNELEKEKSKILEENASLKTELKNSKDNLSETKNDDKENSQQKLKEQESKIRELETSLEDSQRKAKELENDRHCYYEACQRKIKELQNDRQKLQKEKESQNELEQELENKKSQIKSLKQKNEELENEASKYQSALGIATDVNLNDDQNNNNVKFNKDILELHDTLENYVTNLKPKIDVDINKAKRLLLKYGCKLKISDKEPNKPLIKAVLQRHVLEEILDQANFFFNHFSQSTKEHHLESHIVSQVTILTELMEKFYNNRLGDDEITRLAPVKLRQQAFAALGTRGFNDIKESDGKSHTHNFIQIISGKINKMMNGYRTIRDAEKREYVNGLAEDLVRNVVRIFYLRLLIQEPVAQYHWFENGDKISKALMKGTWNENEIEDMIVEICSFPLIWKQPHPDDFKIFTPAKVFSCHFIKPSLTEKVIGSAICKVRNMISSDDLGNLGIDKYDSEDANSTDSDELTAGTVN